MKKQHMIYIGAGVLALIILIIILLTSNPGGSSEVDDRKANLLLLAEDYISKAQYDRALDLLDELFLEDPSDETVSALREKAIQEKQLAEESDTESPSIVIPDSSNNTAALALEAQRAEAEARSREAAAREAEAAAREREAEAEIERRLAEQRAAEEQRRREAEAAAQAQEEQRLAALSEEEAAKQRQINQILQEARRLQDSEQYIQSRGKIKEVFDIDENSAIAYARLAESYFEEDSDSEMNLEQAVENAESSIFIDPNLWEPYYTLGRIYNETRQYDRAITELNKAADLDTTNAAILYALGNAQFDARRYTDARQSYEASVYLDSSNERAFFNLGLTFERLTETSKALDSYRTATAVKGDYASAYNRIGELLRSQGDLDGAVTNLRKAVEYNDTARNNRSLARALYDQNRYSEAITFFKAALDKEPNSAQNNYNYAAVLIDLGRANEAFEYAVTAVQLDNTSPEYLYTLGFVLKETGDFEQAKASFNLALQQRPGYIKPIVELGSIYIEEGNYDDALEQLLSGYRYDAQSVEINNNLATVYRLKGLTEESLNHSQIAVQQEPNNPVLRYNLAVTLIAMEEYTAAKSGLTSVINLDDEYWLAYHRMAEVLIALEEKDEAKTFLEDIISKNPGYSDIEEVRSLLAGL